jgi:thiazole synthase
MEKNFNSIKERIESGIKNNIPVESKLIMLGEIVYATEREDLTPKEARELEALLNLEESIRDYKIIRELAIFGELVSVETV